MTAVQFRKALKTLRLSQREVARRLYSEVSTVNRWATGRHPIPGPVQAAVEAWVREAEAKQALTEVKGTLETELSRVRKALGAPDGD